MTNILWSDFYGQIAFKLADIKLESSEAYLLKLGKNLSWDFEVIFIFRKNEVLNTPDCNNVVIEKRKKQKAKSRKPNRN